MLNVPNEVQSRELPNRKQAILFSLKTRVFQIKRAIREIPSRPHLHQKSNALRDTPICAELRSKLWTQVSAAEFPLTAGKIENLRLAARQLNGLEIASGQIFSFWRQLGRTTRSKGFTTGRELREGCMVPSTGGGLCQISGMLYQVALKSGLVIVERHAHSHQIPGSSGEQGLDATVFWNYVDLRFRAPFRWRLEVELDASHLIVRIRSTVPGETKRPVPKQADPSRPPATGDCLSCGQIECFRHPSATANHAPNLGHSAFLLDARWPEFDRWCRQHSRDEDHWFTPLDGNRFKKQNYAWSPPKSVTQHHATVPTLLRSVKQRSLPSQGAVRQKALLSADAALAKYYADRISPECRHLVISQNLLPHLKQLGALGGRTYDVLMTRWPISELHRHLDSASKANPHSPTLSDFRAEPELMHDEDEAIANAGRLITPHWAIAEHYGHRAWLIDWEMPSLESRDIVPIGKLRLFLPCSPLGRKGIHELVSALQDIPAELLILGRADEGTDANPLANINWRHAGIHEMADCHALILPAWIEHQPRLALRAIAKGIPVIATGACGLPDHELLTRLKKPDAESIAAAIHQLNARRVKPTSPVELPLSTPTRAQ